MPYSISEFECIYVRCFPAAFKLAVGMLHDEDDARDVVQETFVKLWESRTRINSAEAYILRAVRNTCLNRIASADTTVRFKMGYALDSADATDADSEQRCDEVRAAVDTLLSPRERQIVERVFACGMSYKQTADDLNVSVSLVNKCVVSALKTLRTRFKNQSND